MLFSNSQKITYNSLEMYLLFSIHGPLFTCLGVKGGHQRKCEYKSTMTLPQNGIYDGELSITNNIQCINTCNAHI